MNTRDLEYDNPTGYGEQVVVTVDYYAKIRECYEDEYEEYDFEVSSYDWKITNKEEVIESNKEEGDTPEDLENFWKCVENDVSRFVNNLELEREL